MSEEKIEGELLKGKTLAEKIFSIKEHTLITPNHPKADLYARILKAGICKGNYIPEDHH